MTDAELATASWWASFWGQVENWSFFFVVVFLAVEFAALKFGGPYKYALDNDREQRITAAKLELAKLTAPRQFSEAQTPAIEEALKPFAGITFEVVTYTGLAEPASFAKKISDTLVSAGWVLIPRPNNLLGVASGVYVAVNSEGTTDDERRATDGLVAVLQSADVVTALNPPRPMVPAYEGKRTAIQISVTLKP